MHILVLTGGLGAGKSTASAFFRERGATIVDLDDVARFAISPGSMLLQRIVDEFGQGVLAPDDSLDRAALADVAFKTRESAARLNAIMHPAVAREVGPALAELRLMPLQPQVVVLEVPLLAEAPVYAELGDEVLAISAPEEARLARAVGKGMEEADARRRMSVQAPDAARESLADTIIINDGDIDGFLCKLESFWNERFDEGGFTR
jgi:dephospho-CoA kinase